MFIGPNFVPTKQRQEISTFATDRAPTQPALIRKRWCTHKGIGNTFICKEWPVFRDSQPGNACKCCAPLMGKFW